MSSSIALIETMLETVRNSLHKAPTAVARQATECVRIIEALLLEQDFVRTHGTRVTFDFARHTRTLDIVTNATMCCGANETKDLRKLADELERSVARLRGEAGPSTLPRESGSISTTSASVPSLGWSTGPMISVEPSLPSSTSAQQQPAATSVSTDFFVPSAAAPGAAPFEPFTSLTDYDDFFRSLGFVSPLSKAEAGYWDNLNADGGGGGGTGSPVNAAPGADSH